MKKVIKTEYWRDNAECIAYQEWDDGSWQKREFDENGRLTYQECSDGRWAKLKWNDQGDVEYREYSNGFYVKNYKNEQGQHVCEQGDKDGWIKWISDANGIVGREESNGYREKCVYDENGMRTRIDLRDGHKFI